MSVEHRVVGLETQRGPSGPTVPSRNEAISAVAQGAIAESASQEGISLLSYLIEWIMELLCSLFCAPDREHLPEQALPEQAEFDPTNLCELDKSDDEIHLQIDSLVNEHGQFPTHIQPGEEGNPLFEFDQTVFDADTRAIIEPKLFHTIDKDLPRKYPIDLCVDGQATRYEGSEGKSAADLQRHLIASTHLNRKSATNLLLACHQGALAALTGQLTMLFMSTDMNFKVISCASSGQDNSEISYPHCVTIQDGNITVQNFVELKIAYGEYKYGAIFVTQTTQFNPESPLESHSSFVWHRVEKCIPPQSLDSTDNLSNCSGGGSPSPSQLENMLQ